MATDGAQSDFIRIPLKALEVCKEHAPELLTYSVLVRHARFLSGKSISTTPTSTLLDARKVSLRTFRYHLNWLTEQGLIWRSDNKVVIPCGLHIQMSFSTVDTFLEQNGCPNAWLILCQYTRNNRAEYPQRLAVVDTGLSLATVKRCMKWLHDFHFLQRLRKKVCKVVAVIPREDESRRILRKFNDLRRAKMVDTVPLTKSGAFRKTVKKLLRYMTVQELEDHLYTFADSSYFTSKNSWAIFCSNTRWHWLGI